ncbi:MAG: histone deacetylase [Candidatus Odinarchaeum yellowstonii]|jgi:acetoin utilization deacetylase AcuC-like enzyme|uniref:Histone deacetylase n=1 Tax=Odinarchaeota yellowstonii (strain LCB_4) TaxID=1841599 RepID=A0AAF0D333_ODILC|nr:MAG: histone deacetylase [Candidatus Odinarchaeum yellowstonii]
MPKTGIVISRSYMNHHPGLSHPESPDRIKSIYDSLQNRSLLNNSKIKLYEPLTALVPEVKLVHSEEYINKIKSLCEAGGGPLDLDTFASPETYRTALLAVGGGLTAANRVLEGEVKNAFAFIRPPGHHAGFSKARGFCFFNNIAVLAAYLNKIKKFNRIMIVDLDVHHGNGTQEIFYSSPYTLYLSLHQDGRTLYPGTGFPSDMGVGEGEGHIVNVPLPPGTGDKTYINALEEILYPLADLFKPEVLLVSWGFDTYHRDGLANLKLTSQAYTKITNIILQAASKHSSDRLIILLEGGYNISMLGNLASNVVAALASLDDVYREPDLAEDPGIERYVKKLIQDLKTELKRIWGPL